MSGMAPVEQIFTVSAAEYLAGVEEMVTATDELAVSINSAAEASARLDGTGAGGGAAALDARVGDLESDFARFQAELERLAADGLVDA